MLGNYMNGTSLQGGAFGMRVTSINKIADTKASHASTVTLLHTLVSITRQHFPHVQRFLHDLRNTGHAARSKWTFSALFSCYYYHEKLRNMANAILPPVMASVSDMVQQYTEMRQNLKRLEVELETQWQGKELDKDDKFLSVMTEHRTTAAHRFEVLETLYVNMDAKWKEVMVFYGENPKVMRPDDFFSVFSQFLQHWKDAAAAEEKQRLKKEREAKRARQAEEARARRQEEQIATVDKNNRSMMDDLMSQLRSGAAEQQRQRKQQRRVHNTPADRSSLELTAEDLLRSLQTENVDN